MGMPLGMGNAIAAAAAAGALLPEAGSSFRTFISRLEKEFSTWEFNYLSLEVT